VEVSKQVLSGLINNSGKIFVGILTFLSYNIFLWLCILLIFLKLGPMRNYGGREDGKCSVPSSHCGDLRSFVSEFGRHLENVCFYFRSTPAD
jgi:hypothetical protein